MKARLFHLWCFLSTALLLGLLVLFLGFIIYRGWPSLSVELFFSDTPFWNGLLGREPVWDGIWPACVGTMFVVLLSVSLAFFPGIATGIWLAEYKDSTIAAPLGLAVDVLAGIPSILMGLFGFTLILFLRKFFLPSANSCLLLSALCLAMLILPYLAGATKTALQALPFSLRLSASSLGMTRWQTLRYFLLPQASKGIISGVMLSIGRAAEDTAVIMLTGVVANAGMPGGLFERFEALPFTIFYYSSQYQNTEELGLAFGAALTLLCFTATSFAVAGLIRERKIIRKTIQWGEYD